MDSLEENIDNKDLLKKESVCSYFQPIVCLRTGKIFAYEALIRGIIPGSDKVIPPVDLFAAAEAQNKSLEFDRICQESALQYFKDFKKQTESLLFMNINTSLISSNKDFFEELHSLTHEMGFDPSAIGLELIESRAKSASDLTDFVKFQRDTGFLIVVDDFGCEHSNMERLIQIKPDIIKVDRSIISGIEKDEYRQSILKSIHNLAQMTGSLCLAEGVETEEEVLTCYMYGVDLFQGYAIARPEFDLQILQKKTKEKVQQLRGKIKQTAVVMLRKKRGLTGDVNSLTDWLIRQITTDKIDFMESVFQEFMIMNPEIESIYVLDEKGIQISNTILSPFLRDMPRSYIFAPGNIGDDNSFKPYFVCFEAFNVNRYLSDPYLSIATGNIVRTLSVKLWNRLGNSYKILCIDFVEEVVKTPIP